MSQELRLENRDDFRAAGAGAVALWNGDAAPKTGERPLFDSDEYWQERAELSAVLVGKTVDRAVVADDSALGYRFSGRIPRDVKTQADMRAWTQRHCHRALDGIIKADPAVKAIAQRHQDLLLCGQDAGQPPSQQVRRETILFDNATTEPHAWLNLASVAAAYHQKPFQAEHALPFLMTKLPAMQITARGDMAVQNVRSAILEACNALGELHNFDDSDDQKIRFELLKSHVLSRTKHQLPAQNFGELYQVSGDEITGISLVERPEGFGQIKPYRNTGFACPAAYRIHAQDPGATDKNSALNRLLRASLNAMADHDLFKESLGQQRNFLPKAHSMLNQYLMSAQRADRIVEAQKLNAKIIALGGVSKLLGQTLAQS